MKVLLVYENVPESTDFYLVDADDADIADLTLAHGNYLNGCDAKDIEEACNRLMIRISDPETVDEQWLAAAKADKSIAGKWLGNKSVITTPISVAAANIELVVVTGYIM